MTVTLSKGIVTSTAVKFDKFGRPYLDVRLQLTWIENVDAFLRQTTVEQAIDFTSKGHQPPLFHPPEDAPVSKPRPSKKAH